jgi:lipopolysaccharide biosynthesis glycosyltransferase
VTSSPIHLLLCSSDAYAPHLATTLRSIVMSSNGTPHVASVVSLGMRDDAQERVQRSVPEIPIEWFEIDPRRLEHLPVSSGGSPSSSYALLLAPTLLPTTTERVIALDCDLLVRRPLDDLWSTDLRGNVLAAALDSEVGRVAHPDYGVASWRELGLDGRLPYLNAGVLVIDVAAWRTGSITERCLELLARPGLTIRFADQDVLNAVFAGRWTRVDTRWNVVGRGWPSNHLYTCVPPDEVDGAIADPAIVHYAGVPKPWSWERRRRNELRFLREWEAVAETTEFRDWYEALRLEGPSVPERRWSHAPAAMLGRLRAAARVLIHGSEVPPPRA